MDKEAEKKLKEVKEKSLPKEVKESLNEKLKYVNKPINK